MEILSSGKCNKDGSVIFECPNCGCKFKAGKDEYYQDHSNWTYGDNITLTGTYTYTNTFYNYYHANCPECHKMCCKSIPVCPSWTSSNVTLDADKINTGGSSD